MRNRSPDQGHDFAGSNTTFVLGYLLEVAPPGLADEVLRLAEESRTKEELCDPGVWSSYSEFRNLLEAASALLGGPSALGAVGPYALDALRAPELVSAIHALGSPEAVLANMGFTISATAPVLEMNTEEVTPANWIVRLRVKDGFEPFPELCHYIMGLNASLPKLFGHRSISSEEESCQCLGAPACEQRVRWETLDADAVVAEHIEFRAQLYEARLEALQQTVAELVSGDGLESLLPRIVSRAARAVQAPAYILAIDDPSSSKRRVYCKGITDEEARGYSREVVTDTDRLGPNVLVVNVVSGRCDYGHLVGIRSEGGQFDPQEVSTLTAYASLAAAALDSAAAIDDARRQATTARALLDLSSSLVQVTSISELGTRLAEAVPLVIDCDRAVVTFVDEPGQTARAVATYGYGPADQSEILSFEFSLLDSNAADLGFRLRGEQTDEPADDRLTMDLRSRVGSVMTASLPIKFGDRMLGWITADVTERPERLRDSPDVVERLQGLAGQAAIAVANARLLDEIRHQALHDSLTGLPNRVLLLDHAEKGLARSRRYGTDFALLFIDLDGFKFVNDTLGHEAGDELLKHVAIRFRAAIRETDVVGRLGGDEFIVLAEGKSLAAGPDIVADRLLDAVNQPFYLSGSDRPVAISASIGIAVGDRSTAQHLLRDADVALYAAKANGKKHAMVFRPDMIRAAGPAPSGRS